MSKLHTYIIGLIFCLPGILLGQVEFTASVSQNSISKNQIIQLKFSTSAQGSFSPPNFANWRVVGGPYTGSSSHTNIVNGRRTSKNEYTYTYQIAPQKTGRLSIGSASIKVQNKTYKSNVITVNVAQASAGPAKNSNLFAQINVNRKSVYQGQPIYATYKVYTRYRNFNFREYDFKKQDAFWTEDIKVDQIQETREVVNGLQYRVFVLKKEVLFPQKSGGITLTPFEATCLVNGSFFNPGNQEIITSSAPHVTVKEFPINAPASFNNQVGKYSLEASINKTDLEVDEDLTLKVKIKGNGNIKQLADVNLNFPKELEVYDPEVRESISVNESGSSGWKEFSYLLIPRYGGKFKFGPIELSYFDPTSKTYKTITSEEFEITVKKSDGTVPTSSYGSSVTQNNVEILNTDIRYIKSDADFSKEDNVVHGTSMFRTLLIAPPVLFAGLFLILFIRKNQNVDEAKNRRKTAKRTATKRFVKAQKFMQEGDDKFSEEMLKALYGYLGDKLSLNVSELSKSNLRNHLGNRKVSETASNDLIGVIELLEMNRYAPVEVGSYQDVYNKGLNSIQEIENELK